MKQLLIGSILLLGSLQTNALNWQNLWLNKNQQAQQLMKSGHFPEAEKTFTDPEWQATAAYRSGNYKTAARQFQSMQNKADAYYNQGNALAHNGQLKEAINAYDKALTLSPGNQDALYNRDIVKKLLKKQEQQNKKNHDKPDQNKQDQDTQQSSKPNHNKPDQSKLDQEKQAENQLNQDKNELSKPEEKAAKQSKDQENQQEKEQWLRLIPDDPGGLMRAKFKRDYWERHQDRGY